MKPYIRALGTLGAALTLALAGCGGGGGGGAASAAAPTAAAVVAPSAPPPAQTGIAINLPTTSAQTFEFPNFGINSRLTVVANFFASTENSTQNATASVTLSGDSNVATRRAPEDVLARLSETDHAHCGVAEVLARTELRAESSQQLSSPSPTVQARFQQLAEGDQSDFFLIPANRSVTTERVLQPFETVHCQFFAEVVNGQPVLSREQALFIAQAFDSNNPASPGQGMYDQLRAVFGSEWNQNPVGGNDGDTQVVMVFYSPTTVSPNILGFVSSADANPNGGTISNRGEILYIQAGLSPFQTLATVAHEFQHLINQNEKLSQQGLNPPGASLENVALNEGLSALAEDVAGFDIEAGNIIQAFSINSYLAAPQNHSFFDFSSGGGTNGQGYLFFRYVLEQFGENTIRQIVANPGTGLSNLEENVPGGFAQAFQNWSIANFATNLSGSVPAEFRYPSGFRTNGSFPNSTLSGPATVELANDQTTPTSLLPWSAVYFEFDSDTGSGLTATVNPAQSSPFALIFEALSGQLSSVESVGN